MPEWPSTRGTCVLLVSPPASVAQSARGFVRECLQPRAHTRVGGLKPNAHAQPHLIGVGIVDMLIPDPVDEPGVVVIGQRPRVSLHGR